MCECDVVRFFAGWGSWELLADGASWSGNLEEKLRCISGDNWKDICELALPECHLPRR